MSSTSAKLKRLKRPFWHYSGDINIEHSGMFYNLATFEGGHVECWRLQPCSDAGGPDNCYWIEHLVVIIHDGWKNAFWGVGTTVSARRAHRALHDMDSAERTESALACIGYDSPDMLADWDKRTLAERKHIIFEACIAYGHYDQESVTLIRVGPNQEGIAAGKDRYDPETVLRSNTNLHNYVRGKCE